MPAPATFVSDDAPASFQPDTPKTFVADEEDLKLVDPNAARAKRISTTEGGRQLREAGAPGAGAALARQMIEGVEEGMQPIKPIPRIPQQKNPVLQLGAGTVNAALSIPEFMESPMGIVTAPLGVAGATGRSVLGIGFGGYMATQVPKVARNAGATSVDGTLQQKTEADLNLGASVVLPGFMAKGAVTKAKVEPVKIEPLKTKETFSEFGSDVPPPETPAPKTFVPDETTPSTDKAAVENAAPASIVSDISTPKGAEIAKSDLAAGEDTPLPESVDTLNHQLEALRAGKRPAVLFTPGEEVPKWAQDSEQFDTHKTPAGTFLFDRAELTKDELDQHVANNTVGRVLGYGIDAKPAPADIIGAVTVRDAKGVEKQSVLTDQANLDSVMAAAQKIAGDGDSVRLESPQEVIAARVQAAVKPPTALDEQRRMARENEEAMAALRAQKASGDAATIETGKPISLPFRRNPIPAPKLDPIQRKQFGQDIEPAGRYVNYHPADEEVPAGFERGTVNFNNPLVLDWENWKQNLSDQFAGKTGKQLSAAIKDAGHDGIITLDNGYPKEIVELNENRSTPTPSAKTKLPKVTVPEDHLAQARAALETERPPTIHDDIQGQITTGPVKFPVADFADTLARTRDELAQALYKKDYKALRKEQRTNVDRQHRISTTEGMPADEVLQGLAMDNPKYADWSVDDLADAMGKVSTKTENTAAVRQLAEEIARAEQARPARTVKQSTQDYIENWFDDAIEATSYDPARMMEGVTGAPVWLTKAAANGALRVAKLAYTTTRDLAKAIAAGIEHLRSLNLQGFSDAEARQWILSELNASVPEGMGVRQSAERTMGTPTLSPEVKNGITEFLYKVRPIDTDKQIASQMLDFIGVENAIKVMQDPPADLPGSVRVALGGRLLEQLASIERHNKESNPIAAAEAIEQQRVVADALIAKATDPAQTLRAMQEVFKMSPDAQVARARKEIEKAGDDAVDRKRPEIDQARMAIEQGRSAGVEAVRNDPAVNNAARAAVDEAVTESPDVHKGIVMELAKPWSDSPEILAHAREQVRSKANELLNKSPRPPGFTPAQHLRQILEDLAQRAAGIFSGHIQGSEPGISIVDKLQQRLGLDKPSAQKLATQLSKEWDRQLEAAKKALPARLAKQRARQLAGLSKPETTDTAVDVAIRKQLRELNLKLGQVLRQEVGRRDATGKHVADRVVDASGLSGEKADVLRTKLKERYDTLVKEGQERALAAIEKRSGVKLSRPVRSAFDKLVELDRLGGLNSNKFYGTVKAALKLKQLTDADAKQLRALVKAAHDAPPGWQQSRAQAKALTFIEELKGEFRWYDMPMSLWYANIFSGPMTHAANLIGNSFKALEVVGMEMLSHPTATPTILKAFARGAESGVLEAGNVLRTGRVEGTRLLKAEPARPLEWRVQKGGWNNVFLPWAAVGRALAAEDVLPFKAHEEIKWSLTARRIAKSEGLAGDQLAKRVDDLLHNTQADWDSAKVQAASEGLSGLDMYRRAHEIIEQRRETSIPGSTDVARRYGLTHTFNAEPYGLAGAIAEVLNTMNRKLVFTRFAVPVVRIMANLTNESLAYFPPVGIARLIIGAKTRRLDGVELADSDTFRYHIARAAVGTAVFGALAVIGAKSLDEEDPQIAIYGQGPRTKAQKDLLKAAGWKPNSIKIGNRYYSYQETQAAIPLNILGNYFDAIRYKHLSEQDALTRTTYALQQVGHTILDQRMLSGVADLLDLLATDNAEQTDKQAAQFFARTGSSFVVPNAVRWIDQVFDPAVYQADNAKGQLLLQTPFARRNNLPAINAFGETIERKAVDRFTTAEKPDALVQLLAKKNAWISMPDIDSQIVGDKAKGPDYWRPMTPDELYKLIANSGPEIRRRLQDNMDIIRELDDEHAQGYVRTIVQQERVKAKAQLGLLP